MLSTEHRTIVKATIPLLESGGEALISHFYKTMLAEYPEVRLLFNQAHQATGDQARALANGVLMYARHIDQLEQLGGLVSQIVNKHVSLSILPEHYPIVGACLLRAIREVLGPTDPSKAPPGTIRREFGSTIMVNAAHASDSPENAQREMGIVKIAENNLKPLIENWYAKK